MDIAELTCYTLANQRLVMRSEAHGTDAEVTGKSDYYALLKRGDHLLPFEVWYFDLRDRLPTIAVPLRTPADDVPLNLQSVFADMYRRAYYAESIDYLANVPLPRLKPADAAWVQMQINIWQGMRAA